MLYYTPNLNLNLPPGGKIIMDALSVFGALTEGQVTALMMSTKEIGSKEDAERSMKQMKTAGLLFQENDLISATNGFFMTTIKNVSLLIYAFIKFSGEESIFAPATKMGIIDNDIVFHNEGKVYETVQISEDNTENIKRLEYYLLQRESMPFITPIIILNGFTENRARDIKTLREDAVIIYVNAKIKAPQILAEEE